MTNVVEYIHTDEAPAPGGHYSQATAYGDLVFVSGQLPITAGPAADFATQAKSALASLMSILRAADCGPEHVLRVTAYIVGIENWPKFNAIYAETFGEARPARSVAPVPELHHGYLVEIEAVAARPLALGRAP
jgi:reactive intermediate/imine deaminase